MIRIIQLLLVIFIGTTMAVEAQEFQGVAMYKSHRKVSIKLDSTKVNSAMEKQMQEMLKRQFQKTYKLTFNRESSTYKEEEELSAPQIGGGDMQIMMAGTSGNNIMYKNLKHKTYVNQRETMGKIFLITDSLKIYDWQLEKETKNIGEFTCFKATSTREIEVPKEGTISLSNIKSDKEDEEEVEMITKEIVTTAWYTPQIPVSNGPSKYQGLPGLILEINDGSQTLICTSVVLNSDDAEVIKVPKKGKKVNQQEFDAIMEKKRKEMMERYAPRKGQSSGQSIEIRIGG